jgi:protein-tyrosine phosphatase
MIHSREDHPLTELPFGLPGKIYRSPMPFSPYDPLGRVWDAYRAAEISLVVVLTEPQEYLVHARRDLPAFYRAAGLDVIRLPIPDFKAPPDPAALEAAIAAVLRHAQGGSSAAAHCMAGVGRTGTFMACLAKRHLRLDGRAATAWVRTYIPGALESPVQERFVLDF